MEQLSQIKDICNVTSTNKSSLMLNICLISWKKLKSKKDTLRIKLNPSIPSLNFNNQVLKTAR